MKPNRSMSYLIVGIRELCKKCDNLEGCPSTRSLHREGKKWVCRWYVRAGEEVV